MKRKARWATLLMLLLLVGPALAAGGLVTPRHHVATGGGVASAGAYTLHAAVGQAVTGAGSVGSIALCAGFWCYAGRYQVYLPLVLKG